MIILHFQQQFYYYYLYKKCTVVCPANSENASRGGASQVHEQLEQNKLSYKPLTKINRINRIQKLSEVNTAFTKEQCIMRRQEKQISKP